MSEILARHEFRFNQISNTLQQMLTELQASHSPHSIVHEVNPFIASESFNNCRESYYPHLKLTFLRFDRKDPTRWSSISTSMEYFITNGSNLHALQWHEWLTKFWKPLTWPKQTKAILLYFGFTDYEDPSEVQTRLQQITTMTAYQKVFEQFFHLMDGVPEKFLIRNFIAKIHDDFC